MAPKEKLLQFLKRDSVWPSLNKVQFTLDCWGDFHCVLNSMRVLVGGGQVPKQCNAWTYSHARIFHSALYIYERVAGTLLGPGPGTAACKAPAELADIAQQ